MGILFVVSGKGEDIKLDVNSIIETELKVKALQESYAKSDENECTLIVKGLMNRGGVRSEKTLQRLSDWAKACSEGKDGFRKVEVIQSYAEQFIRRLTFTEAQLLDFKEIFFTDNSKYLEVELVIIQKKSKQEDIKIQLS